MKAVIDRLLNNNLNDLKGLSVEGEIPFTEEFLNELIQLFLENSKASKAPASPISPSNVANLDVMQILGSLDKKEIKIELKEKHAVLKINAKKF